MCELVGEVLDVEVEQIWRKKVVGEGELFWINPLGSCVCCEHAVACW